MDQLLLAIAAHFVGDFAFQNDWMAKKKIESQEVVFYHAATYTAAFVLFRVGLSLPALGIIITSHLIIDSWTSRQGADKRIWQDQILHVLVIGLVVWITRSF